MKSFGIYEYYRRQAEALEKSKNAVTPLPTTSWASTAFDEENCRFEAITTVRRPTGNEVAEHEARLLELMQNQDEVRTPR